MFVSEYFDLDDKLDEKEVFDCILDKDSHFFINLMRLKVTTVPKFEGAYQRINDYFSKIAMLLNASSEKGDKMYKTAVKCFDFSEVNGINLGFSESRYGAGFGKQLREQVISDAFDIIKKGIQYPEIFQLVSLFEENIGPDRLSDMVATIIYPDIVAYTKRIQEELEITKEKYPDFIFQKDGLVVNPYKRCEILFLPTEILHELPIAECWDDIDRVVSENDNIRREINEAVGLEWNRWYAREKKAYLKEHIFKDPERCGRVIEEYRKSKVERYDLNSDVEYFVATLIRTMKREGLNFVVEGAKEKGSLEAAFDVLNIFKDWVENNRGWDIIQSAESSKREKIVQRLVHLGAKNYIDANNLDISFEPDAGRGPVDFKVSRGGDKTVIEIKLSTNGQYLHGYQEQVEEYGKAECTEKMIYVFVDLGNPGRLKKLKETHEQKQEKVPQLVVIDATSKNAASTYTKA